MSIRNASIQRRESLERLEVAVEGMRPWPDAAVAHDVVDRVIRQKKERDTRGEPRPEGRRRL